jgi:PAS domain S-box-containing protein
MLLTEQQGVAPENLNAPTILKSLLDEFSAVTDYRTLRDSLPRRLAHLLQCRCVLLYQRIGETLQFASGSFDETPGWSSSLLEVAHINPISTNSDSPEAQAWRSRHPVTTPTENTKPTFVAVPLIYRQHAIGVFVVIRTNPALPTNENAKNNLCDYLSDDDIQVIEVVAGVTAMLLENTRLLERDWERIHELSLLNSISSQLHRSMHKLERVRNIVVQRALEISNTDLCELILPSTPLNTIPWITPNLHQKLLQCMHGPSEPLLSPLVIERPVDLASTHPTSALPPGRNNEYLSELPGNIKTFFAIPMLSSDANSNRSEGERVSSPAESRPKMLGILVGAYHRPWKLRHAELILLQVLASQAGAILENISLMAEVVEARTQARKLLRRVLDDQRLKELILKSIPSGLITLDLNGCITTFNTAAEAILGYYPSEVLGQSIQSILNLKHISDPNIDIQEHSSTLITVDRQGREVVLDVSISPLRDDRGQRIGVLVTFSDITSVHRLEEEKRRLDRLAALGEMAANVAHEVRNPLASIKTSVQLLKGDLLEDTTDQMEQSNGMSWTNEETRESVSIVLKEIERLDSIVHDLLLFARPRQLHCVSCNLPELNDRVLQFLQPQFDEVGIVVHRLYQTVPPVQVDVDQVEQVLFNLYTNALQAMLDGGVLTVSCQELPDRLEFTVNDTGVGIPPDQLDRIFQPFFTTKAHGIGLGLPITRRLIEDHHGQLLVESQLSFGTTVTVRLPLASDLERKEES